MEKAVADAVNTRKMSFLSPACMENEGSVSAMQSMAVAAGRGGWFCRHMESMTCVGTNVSLPSRGSAPARASLVVPSLYRVWSYDVD